MIKNLYDKKVLEAKDALLTFSWEDPQQYSDWLAQTYFFVLHSTRLLTLAAARCSTTNQELHYRFVKHTSEESRHEVLLLNDLKAMGLKIDGFNEISSTSAFYQTQYFQIEHISSVSFFGYILVLEGLAVEVGDYIYEVIKKAHGANKGTFLKIHSSEDPEHLAKAFKTVESLDSTEVDQIVTNMNNSFDNYLNILRSIEDKYSLKKAA